MPPWDVSSKPSRWNFDMVTDHCILGSKGPELSGIRNGGDRFGLKFM